MLYIPRIVAGSTIDGVSCIIYFLGLIPNDTHTNIHTKAYTLYTHTHKEKHNHVYTYTHFTSFVD